MAALQPDVRSGFLGPGPVECAQIVTGAARYSTDIHAPGILYARFIRCPHGHAKVVSGNVPESAGVRHTSIEEGKECFYAGDNAGIVVAETQEAADEAALSAMIRYEVLKHVVTLKDALTGRGILRDGDAGAAKANDAGSRAAADGFVVWAGEKLTLERTYSTQVQTHSCMETHSYTARQDNGRMTVWASTQSVQAARDELSRTVGGDVRVVAEYVGGGFGSKFGIQDGVVAAYLARELDAPVKLHQARAEEHTSNGNRPPSIPSAITHPIQARPSRFAIPFIVIIRLP